MTRALLTVCLWLLACGSGLAELRKGSPAIADCIASSGNMLEDIRRCTAVINAGGLSADDQALAYAWRGVAYGMNGQSKRALADYDRALAVLTDDADLYVSRGDIQLQLGRKTRAKADYDRALQLDPANHWAQLALHTYFGGPEPAPLPAPLPSAPSDQPVVAEPQQALTTLFSDRYSCSSIDPTAVTPFCVSRPGTLAELDCLPGATVPPDCVPLESSTQLPAEPLAPLAPSTSSEAPSPPPAVDPATAAASCSDTTAAYETRVAACSSLLAAAEPGSELARLWRVSRAKAEFENNQYEPALSDIETLLAEAPGNVDYLVMRAALLAQLKRYDEARLAVAAALAVDPNDERALKLSGVLAAAAALLPQTGESPVPTQSAPVVAEPGPPAVDAATDPEPSWYGATASWAWEWLAWLLAWAWSLAKIALLLWLIWAVYRRWSDGMGIGAALKDILGAVLERVPIEAVQDWGEDLRDAAERSMRPSATPVPAAAASAGAMAFSAPLAGGDDIVSTGPGDKPWLPWLLASLAEAQVQRPAKTWSRWSLNSLLPYLLVLALSAGIGVLRGLLEAADGAAIIPVALIAVVGIFLILRPAQLLLERRRARYLMHTAEQELAAYQGIRPIFYLRSFGLDQRFARSISALLGTAEDRTMLLLRKIGPVIAIGRPGETLPSLGAARLYISDNLWRQKVADILSVSQLVLWTTGVGEGLRWELDHIVKRVPPERLIVWAHPALLFAQREGREKEWTAFRDSLGKLFPKPLPAQLGDAQFLRFKADFEPIPIVPAEKNRNAIIDVLEQMAIPPFDSASLAKQKRRRRLWLWTFWGGLAAVVLIFLALGTIR